MSEYYDKLYESDELFWGSVPTSIARILFQRQPRRGRQTFLDIGCGEGRDAIFFAQNGYRVTAFDLSSAGVKKASAWAGELGLSIDFFQEDVNKYRLDKPFDVIFASSALHYIPPKLREEIIANYKQHTKPGGIHAFTVPIFKLYLPKDPEADKLEQDWRSGEILTHYHDWQIDFFVEQVLDDPSGYPFPVNRLIAVEPSNLMVD